MTNAQYRPIHNDTDETYLTGARCNDVSTRSSDVNAPMRGRPGHLGWYERLDHIGRCCALDRGRPYLGRYFVIATNRRCISGGCRVEKEENHQGLDHQDNK